MRICKTKSSINIYIQFKCLWVSFCFRGNFVRFFFLIILIFICKGIYMREWGIVYCICQLLHCKANTTIQWSNIWLMELLFTEFSTCYDSISLSNIKCLGWVVFVKYCPKAKLLLMLKEELKGPSICLCMHQDLCSDSYFYLIGSVRGLLTRTDIGT